MVDYCKVAQEVAQLNLDYIAEGLGFPGASVFEPKVVKMKPEVIVQVPCMIYRGSWQVTVVMDADGVLKRVACCALET